MRMSGSHFLAPFNFVLRDTVSTAVTEVNS